MKEYITNWKKIEIEECSVLLDAVARYMSSTEYPDINVILAILAIEEVEK